VLFVNHILNIFWIFPKFRFQEQADIDYEHWRASCEPWCATNKNFIVL